MGGTGGGSRCPDEVPSGAIAAAVEEEGTPAMPPAGADEEGVGFVSTEKPTKTRSG